MGDKYKSTPEQLEYELERLTRAIQNHAELVNENMSNRDEETRAKLSEDHRRVYQMFLVIMEHTGYRALAVKIIGSLPPQPLIINPSNLTTRREWSNDDEVH